VSGDAPPALRALRVTRPRLLDLFCGAGGAAMGYHRAGFDVVGVDIEPQPHYPFEFHQADALTYPLEGFDAIHASPPCQAYSRLRTLPWLRDKVYWDSIPPTRARLLEATVPWVMENVEGSPIDGIYLCGTMFGLAWPDGTPLYRHRPFETTWFMLAPGHPKHSRTLVPGRLLKGRARLNNGYVIGGHQNGLRAMGAMGIDWMTGSELSQAIPPAYTEWIGGQLLAAIEAAA
jgi:DNA (cytosine-5)-methyltransferase 1